MDITYCSIVGILLLFIVVLMLLKKSTEKMTPVQGEPVIPAKNVNDWNTIGTAIFTTMPAWFDLPPGVSQPNPWIYTLQGRVIPGRDKEKYEYRVYVQLYSRIGGVMSGQHFNRIVETGKIVNGDVVHIRKELTPMKVKISDNNWDIPWKSVGWGLFMASENVNPSYTLEGRKVDSGKYDFRMYQGVYPKTQERLALRDKTLRNRERVVAKSGHEFMVFITHPEWDKNNP
jgi:hypothetical protein